MTADELMAQLAPSILLVLEESIVDAGAVAGPGPVAVQLIDLDARLESIAVAVYVGPHDAEAAVLTTAQALAGAGARNVTADEQRAWLSRGAVADDHSASRRLDVLELEAPHLLADGADNA